MARARALAAASGGLAAGGAARGARAAGGGGAAGEVTVLVDEASMDVSPSDPRRYRLVALRNGLRALLVSDADATQAVRVARSTRTMYVTRPACRRSRGPPRAQLELHPRMALRTHRPHHHIHRVVRHVAAA